jgi:hypothetical protein
LECAFLKIVFGKVGFGKFLSGTVGFHKVVVGKAVFVELGFQKFDLCKSGLNQQKAFRVANRQLIPAGVLTGCFVKKDYKYKSSKVFL